MVKGKILSITNLTTTAAFKAKINETKSKIPGITNLASTNPLNAVENKLLNVSNVVKKTDYNTKINDIKKKISDPAHDKYIKTPEFNTLTTENFTARLT